MLIAYLHENKARIVDGLYRNILQSMASGLLVADKNSHRILKVNQAMERLSRRSADEMVGRTVEDVFAGLQGLPITAFADEVQLQGSITLRKHRLVDPEGREQGVLVLVDDVSEREILRDTFSRYLSQPVMEQVLSDKASRSLRTSRREVSVLFADIRGFTTFAERRQPEAVVTVLNQYFDRMVRVVFDITAHWTSTLATASWRCSARPWSNPIMPGTPCKPRWKYRRRSRTSTRPAAQPNWRLSISVSTAVRPSSAISARKSAWSTPSSAT